MDGTGTSADDEDVASNPLFLALRRHHPDIWQILAKPGMAMVIPGRFSLTVCDRATIEQHALQSTGVDSTFKTLDGRVVAIGEGKINTIKGFSEHRQVSIAFEESYYADDDTSVRLIVTDRPFVGGRAPPPPPPRLESLEECMAFLQALPNSSAAMKILRDRVADFASIYETPVGFEPHARNVLHALAADTIQVLLQVPAISERCKTIPWMNNSIAYAVESAVMAGAREKLLSALKAHCRADDIAVQKFCAESTPDNIGVRPVLLTDISGAASMLRNVDVARTPAETLRIIGMAITSVVEAAASNAARPDSHSSDNVVSGDDVVPLTLWLLAKTQMPCAASISRYLQNFAPADASAGRSAYHLATFCAAVQFAARSPPPTSDRPARFASAPATSPRESEKRPMVTANLLLVGMLQLASAKHATSELASEATRKVASLDDEASRRASLAVPMSAAPASTHPLLASPSLQPMRAPRKTNFFTT
eukprot:TRINITY_DN2635_c0_g1_i2.p1 TRINITY_DN2635_c0_g1~~TRINITY_DN2635_c0_g1_i2.p1  ORF type:complete len:481 (+),score=91.50 TRINITY_DN2635_c0_g1_i2:16-1458(+)